MEMNTKNILYFMIFLIILILIALAITSLNTGTNQDISIESRFPGKIVYTTNTDADVKLLRNDCQDRGGEFNECGSVCAPDAEVCAEVCAFTCELPEEDQADVPEDWEEFSSENLGFSIAHPSDFDVEEVQVGPSANQVGINISVWGPTQEPNTEFFDGISMTFAKESSEDLGANISVQNYTQIMREREIQNPSVDTVSEISEVNVNGIQGFAYTTSGMGEFAHLYFPLTESNQILHINYTAPDPTDQGFQETVNQILNTLRVI